MRVLLVDIDSLRPDHMGCYGYGRDTSPTIDAIADRGIRFENCYVSDSPCLPSRTALATCRFGAKTGVATHYGPGQWLNLYEERSQGGYAGDRTMSFERLWNEGIHTASVSSFAKRHAGYHFSAAFRESIQPTTETGREDATSVTSSAGDWLERHAAGDDWLLHVNYWDVHHPYRNIERTVDTISESGPMPDWPDEDALAAQAEMTGSRCATLWPTPREYEEDSHETGDYAEWPMPETIEDRSDVVRVIDGYDASIRTVDSAVATLLSTLESAGVREETAIVITGDHGEALGEHGIYAEHAMAHPPCQRVPMIVSWPGVTDSAAGTQPGSQIYQFDLMATICDLAGVEPPSGWDAKRFTPALRGDAFNGREYLVCGHGIYTFGRAVYSDDWVYIRLLHPGVFSLPGVYNDDSLQNGGLELLHNTREDPHMTENRIEEEPVIAAELRAVLDSWTAQMFDDTDELDPLVEMATTDGPFLYVDPDGLESVYSEMDTTEKQREIVGDAWQGDQKQDRSS